jgi:polyphosphate kinase
VVEVRGMIGLADLKELVLDDRPDLLWPSFTPRVPERVQDHDGDMFAAIRQKDMLLHHPYETFDMVVRFLSRPPRSQRGGDQADALPHLRDSPIVEALCEAAEDGKSVTALVELKARFDEAANIRQSRRLERAGAHVVYGFIDYKTHAKISTVVRREGDRLVTYTHYGTGNYHPITARIYTDLSFFTCDAALGRDATKVFNYLSGYAEPEQAGKPRHLAPLTLKTRLIEMIAPRPPMRAPGARADLGQDEFADRARRDRRALRRASQAGVKIDLVIRGICGLRPGIKGLSRTSASNPSSGAFSNIRASSVSAMAAGCPPRRRGCSSARPTGWAATSTAGSRRWWKPPTHRQGPDREPDHGRQPRRRGAKLGHGPRWQLHPRHGGPTAASPSTATASSWKTPRFRGAARRARRMCPS